jgi:ribonuclease D
MVDRQDQLQIACEQMARGDVVALDTEFMREKTYAPGLCLVQLRGEGDPVLLDPLALEDLSPLSRLFSANGQEVVLHSSRQDLEALATRMTVSMGRMFDTQVAAAFCGYGDQVSYAALVSELVGVDLDKAHTRADWSRRPLPPEELEYAADDVRHLHALRDQLAERLEASGRMSWFRDECARQLDPLYWQPDPEQAWRRLKRAATLPAVAQETARRLAVWRETRALERNRPREWILPSSILLAISNEAPRSMEALGAIDGISQGVLRKSGREILEICLESPRDPDAELLWRQQELLPPADRKRVRGIMRLIREVAEDIGISPSLLANRSAVERFVRDAADIDLFRGWRRAVAGERVLRDYS